MISRLLLAAALGLAACSSPHQSYELNISSELDAEPIIDAATRWKKEGHPLTVAIVDDRRANVRLGTKEVENSLGCASRGGSIVFARQPDYRVALHEIGHFIAGVSHLPEGNIMQANAGLPSWPNDLTQDDIDWSH